MTGYGKALFSQRIYRHLVFAQCCELASKLEKTFADFFFFSRRLISVNSISFLLCESFVGALSSRKFPFHLSISLPDCEPLELACGSQSALALRFASFQPSLEFVKYLTVT